MAARPSQRKPLVHVLVTRIGIGVYDEAWFDYRLGLFEAITVPSMRAQTCQDFTWLLVVDSEMPTAARERLDRAVASVSNVVIAPVEFKTDLKKTVVSWAKRRAAELGAKYVMTSRLDDDDAMRVDAFERLHREAVEFLEVSDKKQAVFSFNVGCMWLPSRRLGYTRYHDSHSLALSLIEPADRCQSIHAHRHQEIKTRMGPRGTYFRGIDGDTRWWLYAAHTLADSDTGDQRRAENISSHRYGYRVDDSLLTTFGLAPDAIKELADLGDPKVRKPVLRQWLEARDYEQEIRQLRSRLAEAGGTERSALSARLAELDQLRRAAGSGIVDVGER